VADQNAENAARAQHQQELRDKQAAGRQQQTPPRQRPTTSPAAELAKAQGALERVEQRLRAQYEKGEDYVKASGELKSAQDAYDAAYKGVVTRLGDSPEYAAAVKRQQEAEGELAAARQSGQAAVAAGLASTVMEARTAVHKMEAEAAGKDDGVTAAKAKVAEAKGAVDELRKGFEEKMKQDPDYVAAVQAVEDAKAKKA
jgi:hypothetical protein